MTARARADLIIRMARADDDDFIIGLAPRFAEFNLPPWRKRNDFIHWLRAELTRYTRDLPPASHLFVAEDEDGQRVGFVHLLTMKDAYSDASNCHVSDLACAPGHDGQGIGAALLAHAESWARRHRCRHLTLAVFPGNERAIGLYQSQGFAVEVQRMVKKIG